MNWCIQDISLLYKSKNLHIKKYLDDLSLKRSWVVITKVASWSRNEPCLHSEYTIKSSLFNNVTFRMVINVMNCLYQNKPDEHSQILVINIYICLFLEKLVFQLTESQEAHEHQDHHPVQEVVGVADGRHRPAGSRG